MTIPMPRVVLLVSVLALLIGAERPDDPEKRTARLTVQLVGFPPGTNFTVETKATYELIDPTAPYGGKPPRGVPIRFSEAMVKRSMKLPAPPVWKASVFDDRPVEKTFVFVFPEPFDRPSAPKSTLVSAPVTFSWSDPATGKVRGPRVLGAPVPIRVEPPAPVSRCFRITHQPRGLRYDVLTDCSPNE